MPINVSWGNAQKTIIVSAFNGEWALEDSHNMIDEMYKLTSSVSHNVHVVLDFTNSLSSPAKMLSSGNHIEKRSSSNTGLSIIVKANGFIKAISQLIMKLFVSNGKLFFVDTIAEAFQMIEQYERTEVKS
ncbi:MAG: hypothetical protein ABI690_15395 [Chloroflexota bacterium]